MKSNRINEWIMRTVFCWTLFVVVCVTACSKAVLDRDEFTALLIDMHSADGMLTELDVRGEDRKNDYRYYNDLFEKYGISRADFDSCLSYYTRRAKEFDAIYAAVIDTLSHRQTVAMRELNRLTVNDTVDLFPGYLFVVSDTIRKDSLGEGVPRRDSVLNDTIVRLADTVAFDELNPAILVRVDSIRPGMYKFKTSMKWDKKLTTKRNRIVSRFLSPDNDTLMVRDIWVSADTFKRDYNWSHYVADPKFTRLEVLYIDCEPDKKAKRKTVPLREGRIWGTTLYNTYVTPKEAARYEKQYAPHEPTPRRR